MCGSSVGKNVRMELRSLTGIQPHRADRCWEPRRTEVTLVLLTTEEDLCNVIDREDVPEHFIKLLQRLCQLSF